MRVFTAVAALLFSAHLIAQPCNMQGVYKIGPGGAYSTIGAALTALRTNGVGGPVILEIKSNYTFISEAGLVFSGIPCITPTNTVTLRPEAGASNIVISSSFNIIILTNASNIIIDGRPGGTGTTSQLKISCSGTTTNAIQFGGNATNNIIQYVALAGNTTAATNGTVAFTGTNCTNNIIRNCRFSGNGTGHPLIGLYSISTGAKHTNNKIQDCEFTAFFPDATGTGHGIYLDKNNEAWEISGNSFYNDIATPQMSIGDINAITINDTLSSSSITGNFIGGTAPFCGGSYFQVFGRFRGIQVAAGKNGYTSIQGNTIRNIDWKIALSGGGIEGFAGIHIASGKVDCGSITANTIGSMTQNGTILITTQDASLSIATGILAGRNPYNAALTDTVNIVNNNIGGITTGVAPGNFQGGELRGINVVSQIAGYMNITNNIIGSQTLANSMSSSLATNGKVVGIEVEVGVYGPWWNSAPIYNLISGNRISHFWGAATGIKVTGGKPQVLNNTISDMSMAVSDGTTLGINCITAGSCTGGTLIQGNHCYNLSLYPQQASGITGITLDLCTGVEVSKNLLHNFQILANSLTPIITGIDVSTFTDKISVINNMISIGVDSTGSSFPQLCELTGIKMIIDTSVISHNSIYISGSGDRNANALYLTKKNNSVCRVTNNILVNLHSQSTNNGFSFNQGVMFDPIFTTTLNGLVMNNNLYHVVGLGSYIGSYNNTRHATLAAWQAATGNESNGLTGNPNYIAPAANATNTNLHIQLPTPADANGVAEAAIIKDVDDELRANLTPVDIGADAISSTPSPGIASFTPATGGTGTTITISGTNFTGATAVSFGGTAAASFTVVNAATITAVVGSGSSGNVSVTTPGGTANRAGFTFIPAPTISSFTPTSAGAGTTITITGTNFTGATAVSFGGTAAASYAVVNATTITAVVGSGSSGNVSVTTPGGTATRSGFTFIAAPTISSFTPTSAGTGTTVTITGTNLTGASVVSFGGTAAASFAVVNATTITAVVGSGSSGSVSVTTPGGTASLAGFTYIPAPTITSFTPTSGSTGTTITITGTNFTGATSVSFGGTAAGSFTVVNNTTITAVVGTGTSGSVTVTTPGGTASLSGFVYSVVTAVGGPSRNNSPALTVSPNPADDVALIKYPQANNNSYIRIIDMLGREMMKIKLAALSKQLSLNLTALSPGVYKITWTDGRRELVRSLLVK